MNSRLIGKKNRLQKHEYLRNTIELQYKECKSCNTRSQFACVVCGFLLELSLESGAIGQSPKVSTRRCN